MTTKGPLLVLRNPSEQMATMPWDRPVLNFAYKRFDRTTRGIRVLGMWFRNPGTADDFDPCLVLLRPKAPAAIQTPCVVRMSQAWIFADAPTGDPALAAAIACDFCNHLGLNLHRNKDVIKVLMVIQDHIQDLLHIPPAPPMTRIVDGEVKFTLHDTGKTIEREVAHRG